MPQQDDNQKPPTSSEPSEYDNISKPKNNRPKSPSRPTPSAPEPPENLPIVEPVGDKALIEDLPKEILADVPQNKEVPAKKNVPEAIDLGKPASIPPLPENLKKNETGKGARGPLPGKPIIPLKQSSSRFGQGVPLKTLADSKVPSASAGQAESAVLPPLPSRPLVKPPVAMEQPKSSASKEVPKSTPEPIVPARDTKQDIPKPEPKFDAKRSMPSIELNTPQPPKAPESTPVVKSVPEKKTSEALETGIGVPLPPSAPSKVVEESKTPEAPGIPKVTPPAAPPDNGNTNGLGGSKNIRPQRFVVLIIVLVLFIVAVILGIWTIFLRPNTQSPTPSPAVLLETPGQTPSLYEGGNTYVTPTPAPGSLGSLISPTPTLDNSFVNTPVPTNTAIDVTVDSDRDGLPDYLETCWGSDPNNPDTDGDGYLDGQEVNNNYDPLIPSPNDKITGTPRCGKP